jgi:hypothetical protein
VGKTRAFMGSSPQRRSTPRLQGAEIPQSFRENKSNLFRRDYLLVSRLKGSSTEPQRTARNLQHRAPKPSRTVRMLGICQ